MSCARPGGRCEERGSVVLGEGPEERVSGTLGDGSPPLAAELTEPIELATDISGVVTTLTADEATELTPWPKDAREPLAASASSPVESRAEPDLRCCSSDWRLSLCRSHISWFVLSEDEKAKPRTCGNGTAAVTDLRSAPVRSIC